jgi:FkbM family methyltransferase
MLTPLKRAVKHSLKKLGYVTYKNNCLHNQNLGLVKAINHLSINAIVDIGANVGQFASSVYKEGFKGKIVSFEPLQNVHNILIKNSLNFVKRNPQSQINWVIAPAIALGESEKVSQINVSTRSSCSSITTMLALHKEALPDAKFLNKEQITIKTLDSIWDQYITSEDQVLVKIDVQGYEYQVLQGANKSLSKTKAVLIEVSISPLFEDQKTWHEILKYLESFGFKLWALNKVFVNERTGKDLQYNALMVKE